MSPLGFKLSNPRHSLFLSLLVSFSTLETTDLLKPSSALVFMILFFPGCFPISQTVLSLSPVSWQCYCTSRIITYPWSVWTTMTSYWLPNPYLCDSRYLQEALQTHNPQWRDHYLSPRLALANLLNEATKQPVTQVRLYWKYMGLSPFPPHFPHPISLTVFTSLKSFESIFLSHLHSCCLGSGPPVLS